MKYNSSNSFHTLIHWQSNRHGKKLTDAVPWGFNNNYEAVPWGFNNNYEAVPWGFNNNYEAVPWGFNNNYEAVPWGCVGLTSIPWGSWEDSNMLSWTIKTEDCVYIEQDKIYVEKTWHSPAAPKAVLPGEPVDDKGYTYFYNNSTQLTTNYNYAIVPFVKAFVSGVPFSETTLDKVYYKQIRCVNLGSIITYLNGFTYIPTTYYSGELALPSDEELGKNLVSGLYLGSFSQSNAHPVWNNFPGGGWPWDCHANTYDQNILAQASIGPVNSISGEIAVNFNENSSPNISYDPTSTSRNNYQFPLMFTPFAISGVNEASESDYPSGLIIVLGVKAVDKS